MEKLFEEDHYVITNTKLIHELIESYRYQLVEEFQNRISKNWCEEMDLELTEHFMTEAIKVINASEEEILNRFFKDASNKCAEMNIGEYFNALFEVAIQSP